MKHTNKQIMQDIVLELKVHAPFTGIGALAGILIMAAFHRMPSEISYKLFYVFHPLHVFLSAVVTTSVYRIYMNKNNRTPKLLSIFIIGYIGSVGLGTLSDSLIPYLGEKLLQLPHSHIHLGFIEEWWLVNPLALAGIGFACWKPSTRCPHAGHVLISTWASLFHIMMAVEGGLSLSFYGMIFVILFAAVWLPCCASDIVFPLLFSGGRDIGHCHHE